MGYGGKGGGMMELEGRGLLVRLISGKVLNVYGPITYSTEHDCYYCDGQSWPREIVLEVVK